MFLGQFLYIFLGLGKSLSPPRFDYLSCSPLNSETSNPLLFMGDSVSLNFI